VASDYGDVGCEGFREALSARLDGEQEPVEPAVVDAHLADCADCRRWFEQAALVTRLIRTAPAPPAVDVTEAVVGAAPGQWRGRLAVTLRALLATLGLVQLVLGLVQATTLRPHAEVHGITVDGATADHLWHESAAWNIAVGAAFLWVASRRGRPVGIVPILTVFIGVLTLLSATDIVAGRVAAARLVSHLFVLTGYLIVLALSRISRELVPPGGRSRPAWRWRDRPPSTADQPDAEAGPDVIPFPGPGRRRPAARFDESPAARAEHRRAA